MLISFNVSSLLGYWKVHLQPLRVLNAFPLIRVTKSARFVSIGVFFTRDPKRWTSDFGVIHVHQPLLR